MNQQLQEFKTFPLSQLCQVVRGSSPRPAGDPRYFCGEFLPWITVAELTGDDTPFVTATQAALTTEGAKLTRIFEPGTVLLTNSGATLGVPKITAIRAGANDGVAGFLELSPDVHPLYLYYYLSSQTNHLRTQVASGVGQPNLNTELIGEVRVPVPTLQEQKAIAAVLSQWDKAIQQTTALITAKEQLKQGLMQKLFDATVRLRGFREQWKDRNLGEVFEERREPGIENLPTLSVTLDAGVIPRDDIDKPVRSALEHGDHRLVRAGDIAYNMMRMWQGSCGMVAEDGLISPAYVACKPSKEIDSRFAHHLFHSPRMIYLFWAYSYGLTDDRRRLYYEEFARIPVLLPPLKEQKKIAAVIDTVDMEIAQLKQNRDALKKQKRGLMQQLLTGKLRIPEKLIKKVAKS